MSINLILPFFSTAVMFLFIVSVLRRYMVRRKLHFLPPSLTNFRGILSYTRGG